MSIQDPAIAHKSSTLRSRKTDKQYEEYKKTNKLNSVYCPLCHGTIIKDFKNWAIIKNNFPYDRVVQIHHMLVPKRHVTEKDLTIDEVNELSEIKSNYVQINYGTIMEMTSQTKTVPDHFHLHLTVFHDDLDSVFVE